MQNGPFPCIAISNTLKTLFNINTSVTSKVKAIKSIMRTTPIAKVGCNWTEKKCVYSLYCHCFLITPRLNIAVSSDLLRHISNCA